jgi:hypothetical protein
MQQKIFNAQTNFQFCICKNVDVTSKKPILIARFLLNADWTKLEEIHLHLIHLRFDIFSKSFHSSMLICNWLNANSRVCLQIQGQGTGFDHKTPLKKFKKYPI